MLAARQSLSSSTSTQGPISVDNRGLNDEAEHHLRVSHFANKQVIVFLDIRLKHTLYLLCLGLLDLTFAFRQEGSRLLIVILINVQRLRVGAFETILLKCVGVLELCLYVQHDSLYSGRNFD